MKNYKENEKLMGEMMEMELGGRVDPQVKTGMSFLYRAHFSKIFNSYCIFLKN